MEVKSEMKTGEKEEARKPLADLQRVYRATVKEKNKYLTIFESLNMPVAVLDRGCRIDTVNPAWADLLGTTAAPGANLRNHTSTIWLATEIDRFVTGGQAEATLRKVADTSIGKRHLSIKIKRLPDVDDNFCGCVIMLEDFTPQEQAREAASRNIERLQGALESAGATCHDLNQPLMAISGYSEIILMECPDDAPYYPKLKKIAEQAAKMGKITKRLMDVARHETL